MGAVPGSVLDHYLHTQYEVIRVVHDNLDAIRSVASHLTPVEDLVDFQEEVAALYAKLGVLTTASELILAATPSGIALLTAADAAAQRLLLELKSAALREAEYFATAEGLTAAEAAIAALNTTLNNALAVLATKASQADLDALSTAVLARLDALEGDVGTLQDQVAQILLDLQNGTYLIALQAQVDDHETRIDTLETQVSGLVAADVEVDSRLTSLTDQIVGQGTALNGLQTQVTANEDGAAVTVARVTELETGLQNLETNQTANTAAIQDLTTLTSMLNGTTISQGELLTALTSRIDNAESDNDATALAVQNLTTTVLSHGALLTSQSDATSQLASRLTDAETGLANNASALSSLSTEVTQLGDSLTIASEDITALKAEVVSPGNLLPNASFEADTHGWSIFNRGGGWSAAQLDRNESAATMVPLSMNALSVAVATQPSGKLGIKSDNLATTGGQRYILSGWLGALNCTATLEWRLLDQAGQIIQFGTIGEAHLGGATDITTWPRLWGEIPANADARELQVQVWIQEVLDIAPKLWLLRPMLEEVSGLQEGPSPWVPGVTGLAKNTAEAVNTLTARIDGVEGDLTATASEVTELGTEIGTMRSALINEIVTSSNKNASFAASINNLSTRMVDAEGDLAAQAGAISTLTTEVSDLEGTVTSHGSSLTSLQAQVNAIDADTGGAGAAISALDTRVTATEDDIESLSSAVTALESSVTSANKIFVQPTAPPTSGRTHNDLWIDDDDSNKPYFFDSGTSTWVPRPDNGKNKIFVGPNPPTATAINDLWIEDDNNNKPWRWNGSTWVDVSDPRTTANATAITSLTTRVTNVEGVNTAQANSITTINSRLDSPTTGLTALATATDSLDTRVSDAEGDISAQATSLQTITTTVNGHTATINTHTTSINGLNARWGVTLDVNGYISGLSSVNNGTKADFTILADNFKVIKPGASARTLFSIDAGGNTSFANDVYLGNGRIVIDTGTHMLVQGIGFGVGNEFIEWFGPKMAITACSRNNAITYKTRTGDGYFGGSLSAGTLRNAVSSSSTVMIGNEITNGPFNTNGNTKQVVVSYSRTWRRTYNPFSSAGYQAGAGANTATIQVYRKIGTAAETLWNTFTVGGSVDIINEFDGPDGATLNWAGSTTLTDQDASVADRTYRAIITAATTQTVTRTDGNGDSSQTTTARLSIISTEQ